MNEPVLEIVSVGLGASLQDLGRRGWKRFGVPPGGAADRHAARWANALFGNVPTAPVLELVMHGACLRAVERVEISVCGAGAAAQRWETRLLEPGEELVIAAGNGGVWTYVGVRGGFAAPRWFGSVSVFPRGGLGDPLAPGAVLARGNAPSARLEGSVGRRWVNADECRDYARPPVFRVWPGPEWDLFPEGVRQRFFAGPWRVSARSDRTGYRLSGEPLLVPSVSLPSEPVMPGSIQVPPSGEPIVTGYDGPTVGGYPKLGLIDSVHLSWLLQCRPGQDVRFEPAAGRAEG